MADPRTAATVRARRQARLGVTNGGGNGSRNSNGGITLPVRPPVASDTPVRKNFGGGDTPNGLREQWQPLHDRQLMPAVATGLKRQLFFNLGHQGSRTWPDSNVRTKNRLPGEFMFSIVGVSLRISPDIDTDDFLKFQNGLFVIYKNKNRHFEAPVHLLGGGGGISGIGTAGTPLINNGTYSTNDYYLLRRPDGKLLRIPVQAEDPFQCAIEWSPNPDFGGYPVFSAAIPVHVILHGQRVNMIDRA